jgi:hypothetical protein
MVIRLLLIIKGVKKMADIKISQLSEAQLVGGTDVFPMTTNGVTMKASANAIKDFVVGTTDNSSLGADVSAQIHTLDGLVDTAQQMIAPIQTTLTASKTYAVGEQFVYNGLLYKATATIAQGGAITIGGNCALADSVTEQLIKKPSFSVLEGLAVGANGEFTASETGFATFTFTVNINTQSALLSYADSNVSIVVGTMFVPANTDDGLSYTLSFPIIKGHTYVRTMKNLNALYNNWIH